MTKPQADFIAFLNMLIWIKRQTWQKKKEELFKERMNNKNVPRPVVTFETKEDLDKFFKNGMKTDEQFEKKDENMNLKEEIKHLKMYIERLEQSLMVLR